MSTEQTAPGGGRWGRMNRNNRVMGSRRCVSPEINTRINAVWEAFELPTQATSHSACVLELTRSAPSQGCVKVL